MNEKRFISEETEKKGLTKEARIIVDTQTGVQYLFVVDGYAGGLTLLVDRDGKPLLKQNDQK